MSTFLNRIAHVYCVHTDIICIFELFYIFQSIIFHVESHPNFPWFKQCVTFNFFPSPSHELAYNLFNLIAMYLAPLCVIVTTYSLVFYEIYKRSKYATRKRGYFYYDSL